MPRCGFSSLAVRVFKVYDVPFGARNILENPELKNAVKSVRCFMIYQLLKSHGRSDLLSQKLQILKRILITPLILRSYDLVLQRSRLYRYVEHRLTYILTFFHDKRCTSLRCFSLDIHFVLSD